MKDLRQAKWMYLKAAVFLLIGITCAGLLLAERPTVNTALLLGLLVWSMCRAYYFAFYVLERYVDPSFKFSGLGAAIVYLVRTRPKTVSAKQTKQLQKRQEGPRDSTRLTPDL